MDQPVGSPSTCRQSGPPAAAAVLSLLLPVKHARDIVCGARYAKQLLESGIPVKVNLLHVTRSSHPSSSDPAHTEAEELLREAALYLSRSHLEQRSLILSGDVVFAILDTAELLNCHEIVLPEARSTPWLRLFSNNIARQIAHAKRSVTLVLADRNGVARGLRRPADKSSPPQKNTR